MGRWERIAQWTRDTLIDGLQCWKTPQGYVSSFSEILMFNWNPNFVPPKLPKRDTNESRNRKMKSWQIDTVFSCDIHNILSLMKNLKTLQPILPKHINFPQKKFFFFKNRLEVCRKIFFLSAVYFSYFNVQNAVFCTFLLN